MVNTINRSSLTIKKKIPHSFQLNHDNKTAFTRAVKYIKELTESGF